MRSKNSCAVFPNFDPGQHRGSNVIPHCSSNLIKYEFILPVGNPAHKVCQQVIGTPDLRMLVICTLKTNQEFISEAQITYG